MISNIVVVTLIDDRPNLHELQVLAGVDGRTVRVMEMVAPVWIALAIALGFDQSRIMIIEQDCMGRMEEACQQMFMRWLDGEHDLVKPCTWDTLIKCLRRAKFISVAESLRTILLSDDWHKSGIPYIHYSLKFSRLKSFMYFAGQSMDGHEDFSAKF